MEVTQTKETMTSKQLDGVLQTLDVEQNRISSTPYKGSDLDRDIPSLLGVSKAVLNNVVFCHSDDSSWPLRLEAGPLKTRFDEIFDTERYAKKYEIFVDLMGISFWGRDLVKFHHEIKLAEINKNIGDFWRIAYKTEDISSIKLVSGQESESQAIGSFNYRVVMNRAGIEYDMRGRCSTGQKFLASVVIRLALAETFCKNFGCIVLDEPTGHLALTDKKGLATLLAYFIGSRAEQSNFQMILMTFDEAFVSIMKEELSSQPTFAMPTNYFVVRGEEGTDGEFYSKIHTRDWETL